MPNTIRKLTFTIRVLKEAKDASSKDNWQYQFFTSAIEWYEKHGASGYYTYTNEKGNITVHAYIKKE